MSRSRTPHQLRRLAADLSKDYPERRARLRQETGLHLGQRPFPDTGLGGHGRTRGRGAPVARGQIGRLVVLGLLEETHRL